MKKLLFSLFSLLTAVPALAEEVIGGADAATSIAVATRPALFSQGLLVAGIGLAGVFLVLVLFFLLIRLMGRVLQ